MYGNATFHEIGNLGYMLYRYKILFVIGIEDIAPINFMDPLSPVIACLLLCIQFPVNTSNIHNLNICLSL